MLIYFKEYNENQRIFKKKYSHFLFGIQTQVWEFQKESKCCDLMIICHTKKRKREEKKEEDSKIENPRKQRRIENEEDYFH